MNSTYSVTLNHTSGLAGDTSATNVTRYTTAVSNTSNILRQTDNQTFFDDGTTVAAEPLAEDLSFTKYIQLVISIIGLLLNLSIFITVIVR